MQEQMTSTEPVIVEINDAGFVQDVIEESKHRPVVVDFWAAWCAPCRQLGPVLEKLATEHGGEFLLAKLDVDANPYTASQFGIQSIPMVIAFADGRPVDQFLGAMPEPAVRQWLERFLPTEADREAATAADAEVAGRPDEAERGYRAALADDPGNRAARLGLGRLLVGRGDVEEAREILTPLSPDPEADRLLAALRVEEWKNLPGTGDALDAARRVAAQGRWAEGLESMLALVRDRPEARQSILDVFSVLGDEDAVTREYRAKLANALF
jgi:putative thioredoxin